MNKQKCINCGLVDLAFEVTCRRCGHEFGGKSKRTNSPNGPREAAKRSSWFYTVVFVLLLIAIASYNFTGVESSYTNVTVGEANRIATQPKSNPDAFQSRSEFEKKQAGQFKNAIQNSPGLTASQKHFDETQKLMQPEPDQTQK